MKWKTMGMIALLSVFAQSAMGSGLFSDCTEKNAELFVSESEKGIDLTGKQKTIYDKCLGECSKHPNYSKILHQFCEQNKDGKGSITKGDCEKYAGVIKGVTDTKAAKAKSDKEKSTCTADNADTIVTDWMNNKGDLSNAAGRIFKINPREVLKTCLPIVDKHPNFAEELSKICNKIKDPNKSKRILDKTGSFTKEQCATIFQAVK